MHSFVTWLVCHCFVGCVLDVQLSLTLDAPDVIFYLYSFEGGRAEPNSRQCEGRNLTVGALVFFFSNVVGETFNGKSFSTLLKLGVEMGILWYLWLHFLGSVELIADCVCVCVPFYTH